MTTSPSRTRFVTLLGTAAAAATATFVASRLGIAGTITGAALVAVIASIGAELYTTAARRTSDRVASLARAGKATTASAADDGTGADGQQELWPQDHTSEVNAAGAGAAPQGLSREKRFSWIHVAAVAGIVFLSVLVGVTALELVAGRPLSSWWTNDDSSGTTIGQVVDPPAATPEPSPPASTATPSDVPATVPATTPAPVPTTAPPTTAPPVTSPSPTTPAAGEGQAPA